MSWTTWVFTWLFGQYVGRDGGGNRYYRSHRFARYGRDRRWVLYKGEPEASQIPPEWHAFLHHLSHTPLSPAKSGRPWQKEHVPNLTGTPAAYLPQGHVFKGGHRAPATGDYEPWYPSA